MAARVGGPPAAPLEAVAPRVQEYPSRAAAIVPNFPLRVLGASPSELERVSPYVSPPQCWGESFEMGRRPFGSRPPLARHALFEVFAPSECLVGPAFPWRRYGSGGRGLCRRRP